jgi:hypothetical protein
MFTKRSIQAFIMTIAFASAIALQGCAPAARLVIGQPDFKNKDAGQDGASLTSLQYPGGPVALYGDSLYVIDSGNNRILRFSPVPATNYPAAAAVIQSSDPAQWTNFNEPFGLSIADDKMFVADAGNHRVLIWNKVPTISSAPDIVLGQADLTGPPVGDCSHMNSPRALFASKDKLIVSEMDNNRVLIWNKIPAGTDRAKPITAELILGNTDCSPDTTGSTRHTFSAPRGVWTDGTKLVVADFGNHRVLIWSRIPASPTDDADIVLGTGTAGSGRNQFNEPYAVASDGSKLFVSDSLNNRILIWDKFPLKTGELPTAVLGQGNFDSSGANGAPPSETTFTRPPTARTLFNPEGVYYKDNQLWVSDTSNNRILLFEIKK